MAARSAGCWYARGEIRVELPGGLEALVHSGQPTLYLAAHGRRILVGTSSWADPGFVKEWYPPKMPAKERLPVVRASTSSSSS